MLSDDRSALPFDSGRDARRYLIEAAGMYVLTGLNFALVWLAPSLAVIFGLVQAVVFLKCVVPRASRLPLREFWTVRSWALSDREVEVLSPRFVMRALEDQRWPKLLLVAVLLISLAPVVVSAWIVRDELF